MSFAEYIMKTRAADRAFLYPYGFIARPVSSCYSNLAAYGVNGAVSGIKNPTPASVVPQIFNKLGSGHQYSSPPRNYPSQYNYPNSCPKKNNPYRSINQSRKPSEFDRMFYDRR